MNSSTDPPVELPVVMIVGRVDRAETQLLMDWLKGCVFPSTRQVLATDISQALSDAAAHQLFPDLVVVLQSWSEEYSRDEISKLLAFAPLARIVVCYGAWCESDGRNHSLWPQSVRVPVWAAEERIEREWRLIRNPGNLQLLPWSASRDETFETDHPAIENIDQPLTFLVDSPDSAVRQLITEIMQQTGHEPVTVQPTILLIDVDPWGPIRAVAVKRLTEQYQSANRVVISSAPSSSMEADLRVIGISRISRKLGFRPPAVDNWQASQLFNLDATVTESAT